MDSGISGFTQQDVTNIQKSLFDSGELAKAMLAQAEHLVAQLPDPSRYSIVTVIGPHGAPRVEIQDNNPDAALYEAQTGALSNLNKLV